MVDRALASLSSAFYKSTPPLWGHASRDPRQGLARGLAPFDPHRGGRGKKQHQARERQRGPERDYGPSR